MDQSRRGRRRRRRRGRRNDDSNMNDDRNATTATTGTATHRHQRDNSPSHYYSEQQGRTNKRRRLRYSSSDNDEHYVHHYQRQPHRYCHQHRQDDSLGKRQRQGSSPFQDWKSRKAQDTDIRPYEKQYRQERRRYDNDEQQYHRRQERRLSPRRRYRGRSRSRSSTSQEAYHKNKAGFIVSDDEHGIITVNNHNTKHNSSSSSSSSRKDDTVGHFKGGNGVVINQRYRILRDVGMGTFGRVVECLDLSHRRSNDQQQQLVAIKIVRNVKRYYDSALVEADIVKHVNRKGGRGVSHCAILFQSFTWNSHYCMVFENLGLSLYDYMKQHNYQPFPPCCVRDFAKQLMEALEFMHSFGLVHTDLKPENILLTTVKEVPYQYHGRWYNIPESTKVKVIDFGGATYDKDKKSCIVATRQYRAPEVLLEMGWSMPSDMWSAGCILAELYIGDLLFATHDTVEHLALIETIIGPFPHWMLQEAKNVELVDQAFDKRGRHRKHILPTDSRHYVEKMRPLEGLIREYQPLLELLKRLLCISPDHRATGHEGARFRL